MGRQLTLSGFFKQAIIPILVFIYVDYELRSRKQKDRA
jgi:hypothetical protein